MKLADLKIGLEGIEELPTTDDSHPYTSAEKLCGLAEHGYMEREFLMRGRANIYRTEADGSIGIRFSGAPYVNRFVVRRPVDPANCSGNVVVEIINPSSFSEIERMWILGHRQFLRTGDIYVGITSKPNTIPKLQEFDAERYRCLQWPNPTPEEPFPFDPDELIRNGRMLPDLDRAYEPGLIWDMLTDLAVLIKSAVEENPVRDCGVKHVVLTGWSQSGDYLIRYMNDFLGVEPVYDGFLPAGAPRHFMTPVNQYESAKGGPVRIRRSPRPCLVIQTESENGRMGGAEIRRPDGDDPEYQVRHYEIAGASHDTQYSLHDYYQEDEGMKRIGTLFSFSGIGQYPNNYPTQFIVGAAFRNLFHWIETGVAPCSSEPIRVDYLGENEKDALGNTMGGVRTCLLDYPTGAYYLMSTTRYGSGSIGNQDTEQREDGLFGHEEPFSAETLKDRYGSLAHYETLVRAHTFRQVSRGFIVREDTEELVSFAVELARSRGLS